ncbi:hypothetical protein [Breoghania sp.]|uniref:hypothetical protein n=1 Tax=Breoghania sp. TaxID=2065378 RepID=UPI0029C90562|nr:hypothetical protein [Breoghania sp.]
MKRLVIMAVMAIAVAMLTGIAAAGSVNIGLGEMDRTEFETLKRMVSGDQPFSANSTLEKAADENVAELDRRVVQDIRQAMSAGENSRNATAAVSDTGPVDIGLGSMSTGEFCDLNKLVASNAGGQAVAGFQFICP